MPPPPPLVPNVSTIGSWNQGEENTFVEWGDITGTTVDVALYEGDTLIAALAEDTANDGRFDRAIALDNDWCCGDTFRVKVTSDEGVEAWSDDFTIVGVVVDCSNLEPYANLSGCVYNSMDESFLDIHGANLSNATIEGTLVDSNLTGTNLNGATFNGDFQRSLFEWVHAENSDFSGDFSEAELTVMSHSTNIHQANFSDANFIHSSIRLSTLNDVSFLNATINGNLFEESSFQSTNFTGATIFDVSFRLVTFTDCDFSDATIFGSIFEGGFVNSTFDGAVISDVVFQGASFGGVSMVGIAVNGAAFETVDASSVDFSNAQINDVAMLENSDFSNANFSNATLTFMLIENTNFSGADFFNATFGDFYHLHNSNFSDVNLTGSNFNSIPAEKIVNVDLTGATCPDGAPSVANSCQR